VKRTRRQFLATSMVAAATSVLPACSDRSSHEAGPGTPTAGGASWWTDRRRTPGLRPPHWSLFDAYPGLASGLQPVPLCTLPSPAERLAGIADHAWVKHDDAIHPEYGGNKIRKLEFVISEILRTGTRHVYSIGGTGSNFGVAAAMVFRELGIELTLFLFEQPTNPHVEHNQALMRHYGAHIKHFDSMAAAAAVWSAHPRRLDPESYFLPAGAGSPVSTFGYVNAAFELRDQIRAGECPEPEEIVVPVGSCSTLAGLTLGCTLAGLKSHVVGVRAAPERLGPVDVCTPAVVRKFMVSAAELVRQQGQQGNVTVPEPTLNHDWFGGCYGCSTPATEAALQRGAAVGLMLDPTYSGKAFGEFLRRVAASRQPVLYWATLNSRPGPLRR
jgi:1-aminocyclopropane-1-carboxylate deaminase/D-cysteine desulfhydrase-like pyridoxal-dependent ACC family enzyme